MSGKLSGFRLLPQDTTFDKVGSSVFVKNNEDIPFILGLLNTPVAQSVLGLLNPTMDVQVRDVRNMPLLPMAERTTVEVNVAALLSISKADWNYSEWSAGFSVIEMVEIGEKTIEESHSNVTSLQLNRRAKTRQLEEENNRLFIEAYGLQDELSPEVPDDQITLYRPDRAEDIRRLLSYAIGCMMGRYSLDKPGLIYAHSGNQGFDPSQYKTFRADDDGIIPLLETDWGIRDDAANRFVEFVGVAWPKEHLEENLKFVAESLGSNNGEQARETIRRYLATGFYKHHLSMYKKRPIYWLFSSGKQRAFQCLVYLHRYHEGTLARMRTEYVIPLLGKMNARLEHLQGPPDQKGQGGEIAAASSATVRRKLEKERDTVKKQIAELQEFDAKLRHYADQRIKLDLDDGVKVNYGKFSDPKFGDILADVKAISGTKDEE